MKKPITKKYLAAQVKALIRDREELVEALHHMTWCAACSEGDWSGCQMGGAKAKEVLDRLSSPQKDCS